MRLGLLLAMMLLSGAILAWGWYRVYSQRRARTLRSRCVLCLESDELAIWHVAQSGVELAGPLHWECALAVVEARLRYSALSRNVESDR